MAKYKVEISGLNTNLLNSLTNQKTIDLIKEYKETDEKLNESVFDILYEEIEKIDVGI